MSNMMYTGISGMNANNSRLSVDGDNIANSGTTAFKSSRVRFASMMSETVANATAPNNQMGGTNPQQIGMGTKVAGIDTIAAPSDMNPTNRNLDNAIDGEGYYIVARGAIGHTDITSSVANHDINSSASGVDICYTRDGAFTRDPDGSLVTSGGYRVLGYSIQDGAGATKQSIDPDGVTFNYVNSTSTNLISNRDVTGKTSYLVPLKIPDSVVDNTVNPPVSLKVISYSFEKDGTIKAKLDGGKETVLGQMAMSVFSNPGALDKKGDNLVQPSNNSGSPVVRSSVGTAKADDNSSQYGKNQQNMLENSNVDLASQFTDMIIASRSFEANTKVITTGDEILQNILQLKR